MYLLMDKDLRMYAGTGEASLGHYTSPSLLEASILIGKAKGRPLLPTQLLPSTPTCCPPPTEH